MSLVICPACRTENRSGAKFCDSCGSALPRLCPTCQTALRAAARFCDECGRAVGGTAVETPPPEPVPAPARAAVGATGYTPKHLAEKILQSRAALEGERKQVSVLFADCVGFTAMSAKLDPEDLHAVMDGCFARITEAVHRYEGTVNQFTGDGVMALFGAPIAHEDHAVRAVAAALAIQTAHREYAETLRRTRGLDLPLRIGINTGPVVVGRIGDDLRMDYTAQGETVNLASRLQGLAPPGGVLISEATERLVNGYFVTTDTGAHPVKGIDRPVHAFAVGEQRRRRGRFDVAVARGLTPLVGRSRELARLVEIVERGRGARGQIISVVGEAGVGKSRLIYELRRRLAETRVLCLEGHCLPHGEALPYHLVAQFLQMNFGLEDGEPAAVQAEKVAHGVERLDPSLAWTVPYLRHVLGLPADELESEGLDQVQRKRRLIDAVKALTLRGAQRQPLVLLAEDLQWIDRNSEEFYRALVDSVAAHSLVLVFTFRPGYAAPWQDRSFHERLTLDPLSEEETGAMVQAVLGAEVSPAVRELVVSRAEGNPFFIEELTRYLRERSLHEGTGAVDASVPATVHDLLTARIDRLPEPLKRTLQLASVLGRDFPLALLEQLAAPGTDIKGHVAELTRLELLREKDVFPDVRLSFSHLLVRQVAYDGLLLKARAELHARAGAALEALYPGRADDLLQDLAEHYAKSADRAKALHYLERAGDRAFALFAYEEAGAFYRRALALVPDGEGASVQAMLLGKRGEAAYARGALTEAREHWSAALAVVDTVSERRLAADLHRRVGVACWEAGEPDEALAHLGRGLAALEGDPASIEAARLYQEFARIHFRRGDDAVATDWAKRALALGAQLAAPDVVSHAYNTWGVSLARAGDIEEGALFVARSLETALAHQLGAVACRAYTNLAVMYATIDHARSLQYCRDGLALAQKIGDQLQQSWLYCTLAGGHCTLAGDYDEGVRAAEAAIELDERLGQRNHLPIPLIILAQVYQCRGDDGPSAHYYRRALEVAEAVGEPQLLFPCYEGLATLAIERGDDAEAERWMMRSREVQETTGWSTDTFLVLPFLC